MDGRMKTRTNYILYMGCYDMDAFWSFTGVEKMMVRNLDPAWAFVLVRTKIDLV